jgi:hypothetical protein
VVACFLKLTYVRAQPFSVNFVSAWASMHATVIVRAKLGFVDPQNMHSGMDFQEIRTELVRRPGPSLASAPPVCPYFLSNSLAH